MVTGLLKVGEPLLAVGAAIVLTYTVLGGMLSVAILDFVQITVIMGGLIYIATIISDLAGGEAFFPHGFELIDALVGP